MAWYTINHTCGHNREVQLYGKNIERENKIKWMESKECPKCWGEKKRAEEAILPITAIINTNGLDTDSDGNILAEIVLIGGTINKKEEIKSMGYHWGEVRGGILSLLSVNKPQQAWIKCVPLLHLEAGHEHGKKLQKELNKLGAKIQANISPIDTKMACEKLAKKEEMDAKITELSKPEKPTCFPTGKWNKKVYGKEKYGYSIYIDGKEVKINKEDAIILKEYIQAIEIYNNKIKEIKQG